jgi:hypothetical protein
MEDREEIRAGKCIIVESGNENKWRLIIQVLYL